MFFCLHQNVINVYATAVLLNLFSQTSYGDAEHFAVLGDSTAGDTVAPIVEDIHQLLVCQRVSLILLSDALLKKILNLIA